MAQERRQDSRYPLACQAVFRTATTREAEARPVNVSAGGILLRSRLVLPEGMELWLQVTLDGRPEAFITRGRIVRREPDALAVIFLEEPSGLEKILRSVEVTGHQHAANHPAFRRRLRRPWDDARRLCA